MTRVFKGVRLAVFKLSDFAGGLIYTAVGNFAGVGDADSAW